MALDKKKETPKEVSSQLSPDDIQLLLQGKDGEERIKTLLGSKEPETSRLLDEYLGADERIKARLAAFTHDEESCDVTLPVCITGLPADTLDPMPPYPFLYSGFMKLGKDLVRDGIFGKTQWIVMGTKVIPATAFQNLMDKISDETRKQQAIQRASGKTSAEQWAAVQKTVEQYFYELLASPAGKEPALDFLKDALGGPEAVEKFLWGYCQDLYSSGARALSDFCTGHGCGDKPEAFVMMDIREAKAAGKVSATTVYKNLWAKKAGKIEKGPFSEGDMLVLRSEVIEAKKAAPGKAIRGFKCTLGVNNIQLARRILESYREQQIKLLGKPDAKQAPTARRGEPAAAFFSQTPKLSPAAAADPAQKNRDFLIGIYKEMEFPADDTEFRQFLLAMSTVSPVKSTEAFKPAGLFLAVWHTQLKAKTCLQHIASILSHVTGVEAAQVKSVEKLLEKLLHTKWNYDKDNPELEKNISDLREQHNQLLAFETQYKPYFVDPLHHNPLGPD